MHSKGYIFTNKTPLNQHAGTACRDHILCSAVKFEFKKNMSHVLYFSIILAFPTFVTYSNSNSHPLLSTPKSFKVFEIQFQLGGAWDGRKKRFSLEANFRTSTLNLQIWWVKNWRYGFGQECAKCAGKLHRAAIPIPIPDRRALSSVCWALGTAGSLWRRINTLVYNLICIYLNLYNMYIIWNYRYNIIYFEISINIMMNICKCEWPSCDPTFVTSWCRGSRLSENTEQQIYAEHDSESIQDSRSHFAFTVWLVLER